MAPFPDAPDHESDTDPDEACAVTVGGRGSPEGVPVAGVPRPSPSAFTAVTEKEALEPLESPVTVYCVPVTVVSKVETPLTTW